MNSAKAIAGILALFAVVMIVWQIFWRSTFFAWDVLNSPIGPFAVLAAAGIAYGIARLKQRKR